jgi:hypothetical protein
MVPGTKVIRLLQLLYDASGFHKEVYDVVSTIGDNRSRVLFLHQKNNIIIGLYCGNTMKKENYFIILI